MTSWWQWIPVVVFPLGMVSPLVVHLVMNWSERRSRLKLRSRLKRIGRA